MTTVNLADPTLDMAAAVVDNLEGVRIANLNRIRMKTRPLSISNGR